MRVDCREMERVFICREIERLTVCRDTERECVQGDRV